MSLRGVRSEGKESRKRETWAPDDIVGLLYLSQTVHLWISFTTKINSYIFKPQLYGYLVTQSYTKVLTDTTPIYQGMGLETLG